MSENPLERIEQKLDALAENVDGRFDTVTGHVNELTGHFNKLTILQEETRDQVKLLAEGLGATNERMDRLENRMDDRFDGVDQRLHLVETTMRTMFAQHGARITALEKASSAEP